MVNAIPTFTQRNGQVPVSAALVMSSEDAITPITMYRISFGFQRAKRARHVCASTSDAPDQPAMEINAYMSADNANGRSHIHHANIVARQLA